MDASFLTSVYFGYCFQFLIGTLALACFAADSWVFWIDVSPSDLHFSQFTEYATAK